ncbi:Eco57I restriction-modification methylase domain-containing protein [Pseudoalteromonas sp. NCIMB_1079]|uniref:Eco57I restriction-modification methylase domain-containing protein n=1 Tax=Pseudoalteromonas sp. NCIMB 1079 TaxID=3142847 RepID=UPI00339D0390
MNILSENELLTKCALAWGDSGAEKGEVFTKPNIVDFMIKTSGIDQAILLTETKILEPSCGQGDFVLAIAKELCKKASLNGIVNGGRFNSLVTAYDISSENISNAKRKTLEILNSTFSFEDSKELVEQWYKNTDFLLEEKQSRFTHVIGNPPYIRIENIPVDLLKAYRKTFSTMKERADIYIAFFEKSLSLLNNKGVLSFICTDRWTKNRYGSSLRKYISNSYQLDLFVDLYGQNAFKAEVLTYPAITQISKQSNKQTIIIHNPNIDELFSNLVARSLNRNIVDFEGAIVRKDVVNSDKPWMFGSPDELKLINRLESEFPLIEDTGCKIYIGAATGNNKVYVVDGNLDIEQCRKIPMVKAGDLKDGYHRDAQQFLINTYDENGVIDLERFPKLQSYLEIHSEVLKSRHIAKKQPDAWFKTIDRVYPERADKAKLLIPDIKSQLTVIYSEGFHPNNSIYYICSKSWSLRALQAVLLSGLGQLFVSVYSTKVSGGNLRFQAQHLRKIRLPQWKNISITTRLRLENAAVVGDLSEAKKIVFSLYNFSESEKQILGY